MVQYRPLIMPLSQHVKGKLKNYLSFLGVKMILNSSMGRVSGTPTLLSTRKAIHKDLSSYYVIVYGIYQKLQRSTTFKKGVIVPVFPKTFSETNFSIYLGKKSSLHFSWVSRSLLSFLTSVSLEL